MLKIKPQNPKGVRDYLPQENQKREYIISLLKNHFELFGFQSIYTPAFERLETLQGKYGDEGDKLLFKILNSGEFIDSHALEALKNVPIKYAELVKAISSKGLRYDHTVPLARFVSQHQNELSFPFKRFVIGPVWRADRPQKGRYQEFFQCDVDIVGSNGLVSDVEIVSLIDKVFSTLNVKIEIKINNRKIYNGICTEICIGDFATKVSTILDKWDKIGEEKVAEELTALIGKEKTDGLLSILSIKSLEELAARNSNNKQLMEGLNDLQFIFSHTDSKSLKFDLRLLRGLDYYTGTVLEVVSTELVYGAICGGGRYDDLTEIFGLKDMSGIGISFGLDRIYDVLTELKRFPENAEIQRILILNLTEKATDLYFSLLKTIRSSGKMIDLYPVIAKLDKQLGYADKSGYSHAIIIGENELTSGDIQIKNLKERKQLFVKSNNILEGLSE